LALRWKELPSTKKDEETYSREFWMFVGAIFLALSCFHLVIVTSIPVWNAMFGTKLAPPTDPVKHYNIIQASFAVVVTFLIGFTQFMKYKKTDITRFFITTVIYLVFAALITALVIYVTGVYKLHFVFILIMAGAIYAILANAKVFADALKGKVKLVGSAVAHIGFGLVMVGALISAGTSKIISENTTGQQFSSDFVNAKNDPRENIIMYRNTPVQMGKYLVTYVGDSISSPNHYFKVDYKLLDANGKVKEEFMLKPNAQANRKMGLVSSPDTKHYLLSDLYTHVNMSNAITFDEGEQAAAHDEANDDKKYDEPVVYDVAPGDTIPFREGYVLLTSIGRVNHIQNIPIAANDVAIGAKLKVVSHGKTYYAEPVYMIKNGTAFDFARKVDEAGLKFRFSKVIPQHSKVEITLYQQPESQRKWIVMRAIQFPYINFLWSGTIIMVIGILLSIFRRNKELKTV
jgi:cytochrome c-type biogenesis protein CcmF